MSEDLVQEISGAGSDSSLPPRWKEALAWADVVIGANPTAAARTTIATFSEAELAELTLTVAVAQGFSKAAIAWGPAPELPTMVIPTPGS